MQIGYGGADSKVLHEFSTLGRMSNPNLCCSRVNWIIRQDVKWYRRISG